MTLRPTDKRLAVDLLRRMVNKTSGVEVARTLQVSPSLVSRIILGKRSMTTDLAIKLGVVSLVKTK